MPETETETETETHRAVWWAVREVRAAGVEALMKEATMTKRALWAGIVASAAVVALAGTMGAWAFPLETEAAAVLLAVLITAEGEVADVKVSKGPRELHESAIAAVRQWRFERGAHDARATLTIRYVLDQKKDEPKGA